MREDSVDLINKHLFEEPEKREALPPSVQSMLEQVTDCYTLQLSNPFHSRKELRNYLVDKYNLSVSQAYNIIALTAQALGNVSNSHKNWIKVKAETLMEEAYTAAKAKNFQLAGELRKQAKTLADIFRLDVDEGELLEAQKYLTIDRVQITFNPEDVGVIFTAKDKEKTDKYIKQFGEDTDFEEIEDEENLPS